MALFGLPNSKEDAKSVVVLCALAVICSFVVINACKSNQSNPRSPSQTAETDAQYSGSDWKYTVESADDLIKNEIINNKITLTPYAHKLGFRVEKDSHGNSTVQTAPGISPNLLADRDAFHSPSRDCSNSDTAGTNLPDSIVLWNHDEFHVAVLTYCVDSSNGKVEYNNDASRLMTNIWSSNPDGVVAATTRRTTGGGQARSRPNPIDHPLKQTPETLDGNTLGGIPAFTEPTKRVRISADDAAALLLQRTEPVYPAIAKAARMSGVVVLHAIISKAGMVEDTQIISGPAMLQQPASEAVKTWRYKPYLLNGTPVEVETTVDVVFSLGG
jgi:TonB family protein